MTTQSQCTGKKEEFEKVFKKYGIDFYQNDEDLETLESPYFEENIKNMLYGWDGCLCIKDIQQYNKWTSEHKLPEKFPLFLLSDIEIRFRGLRLEVSSYDHYLCELALQEQDGKAKEFIQSVFKKLDTQTQIESVFNSKKKKKQLEIIIHKELDGLREKIHNGETFTLFREELETVYEK